MNRFMSEGFVAAATKDLGSAALMWDHDKFSWIRTEKDKKGWPKCQRWIRVGPKDNHLKELSELIENANDEDDIQRFQDGEVKWTEVPARWD